MEIKTLKDTNLLLYHDSLIELYYSPVHDILSFEWPRFDKAEKIQIEHSLSKLGDTVRHYVVKGILIGFNNLQWSLAENVKDFSVDTGGNLGRLQRIGWVTLSNKLMEEKASELCWTLFPDIHESQSFPDKASTVSWLIG